MEPKSTITKVRAEDLEIDSRVQRAADPRRIKHLADDWNDLMVGVLTVSHRDAIRVANHEAEYAVLDGQTRLEAFRLVCSDDGNTSAELQCEVYYGLTLKEEAEIFLKHNDRRAVTPRDRFRLAVTAGEEWALDIRDIAARTGWYVLSSEKAPGSRRHFSAVGAAEKVYALDEGRSLRKTFDMIDSAWPGEKSGVCSETLFGLGLLFYRFEEELDSRSLVNRLAKMGVNKFIAGVTDRRRTNPGVSIRSAASDYVIDIYNVGRRSRRIG
jgi:hypothetical protein